MDQLDGNETFFANQNFEEPNQDQLTLHTMSEQFKIFVKEWMIDNQFVYREQLMENGGMGNFFLKINFADIEKYNLKIAMEIRDKPKQMLSIMEEGVKELYRDLKLMDNPDSLQDFQVQIVSGETPKRLRLLKSEQIGKLIKVQGIVINSGEVMIKGKKVVLQCKFCNNKKTIMVDHGFSSIKIPNYCESSNRINAKEKCPERPYKVCEEESYFINQQRLKIQETNESTPTGETPRTFQMCVERYLCDRLIPGNKVNITGIYTVNEEERVQSTGKIGKLRIPYIYILGYENESGEGREQTVYFSEAEKNRFQRMAEEKDIFQKITRSIGTSIFGNEQIKKAIACLLFGGSSKILPDKTKLRGDINVLLIGDPSTAKSQFLKFVHKVAPICVYTSGKGSSAAGLTAAIIKDPRTRQFNLEGGALVLADGGVVCIDEFDKMRSHDRIAIHEAMEQQTISIAKAGITTILNARTSILAAANPTFGSYLSYKSRSEQIDLQNTILSRFDCIFTVIDLKDPDQDRMLARHVINTYMMGKQKDRESEIDFQILKKFIHYARMTCHPRLTDESAISLQDLYIQHRSKVKGLRKENKKHIPITVRQLEAIIRLSESLAKMRLSDTVTKEDVEVANHIFETSTMDSLKSDVGMVINPEKMGEIRKIEETIRSMLPINQKVNVNHLEEQLMQVFKNQDIIQEAIGLMIKTGNLVELSNSIVKRKNQFNYGKKFKINNHK